MSVAAIPPPNPPPCPVRKFTVAEYRRMCEAGILDDDDRLELLDGWIVPQTTYNPPPDAAVQLCQAALWSLLPKSWTLRIQSAVNVGDSEPEPDLAVVRGPVRRYVAQHPQADEIGLLIEVAETSLGRDRAKLALYAAADVTQCWIVNLISEQLEMYSDPLPESGSYRTRAIAASHDSVTLVLDGQRLGDIPVVDLLP